ncbi:hypothetical protein LEP1GSC109_0788 [Leptospira interrogans str. UI 13372]|nr:hypothetical protein LEP1GSC109_0788 [Leptospira interrogans str. UI 13372]
MQFNTYLLYLKDYRLDRSSSFSYVSSIQSHHNEMRNRQS